MKFGGAILGVLFGVLAVAQPSFEVASIKPLAPETETSWFIPMEASGGMVHFKSITFLDCVRAAYRLRDFQVQGPEWIRDARYEITAKVGSGTMDQVPEMLQALLVERFQLELRRETKEQSVYALVVDSGGPKLKDADAGKVAEMPMGLGVNGKPRPLMGYSMSRSGIELIAPAATFATVTEFLSRMMGRPVIDMTGLTGQYDLTLPFMPEVFRGTPATSAVQDSGGLMFTEPGQTLFDAVKVHGLRLEPRKAPMELLTVVRAQKFPTEN